MGSRYQYAVEISRATISRATHLPTLICIASQLDDWLNDEENLEKWESNSLTASDRRILMATWFSKACKQALQGEAKLKYFQHAGALLTADGTDDDLIDFEGTPPGYKLHIPVV